MKTSLHFISQCLLLANAQLHCFVCTNCPNRNDLDYTVSQPCAQPPGTPPVDTTTQPPSIPPTFTTTQTPNTPPTQTTTQTPNTPPTGTITSTAAMATSPVLDQKSEKTADRLTRNYRNIVNQLTEIYLCFRIERIGKNYT